MYDYGSYVALQYEFGHGLSYTTYEYSDLKVNSTSFNPDDTLHISVVIKNTGKRKGKEVVMLYSSDLYASISPDNKRLCRFQKIELEPKESKTVNFKLSARDLAFYNYANQLEAEKGEFVLSVGNLEQRIKLVKSITFDQPSKVKL